MKKNVLLISMIAFVMTFVMNLSTIAQTNETEIPSWTIGPSVFSAGKTPLTSGMNFAVSLTKGKQTVGVFLNNEYSNISYAYQIKKWVSVSGLMETFKNVPVNSLMINFSFFEGRVKTTHWVGLAHGNPELELTTLAKMNFLFSYQEAVLSSKYVDVSYLLQHYQKNSPNHVPGVKVKIPFACIKEKSTTIFFSMNYLIPSEGPVDKPYLWGIGISLN